MSGISFWLVDVSSGYVETNRVLAQLFLVTDLNCTAPASFSKSGSHLVDILKPDWPAAVLIVRPKTQQHRGSAMNKALKFSRVLPTALLGVVLASGAALAQAEPLGRNQTEGQLLPDQAEEVAPPAETRNLDTTDGDIPVTGSVGSSERPAAADDDVPDENRSISGKVQEEEAEN